jgi:HAD superfamily hydrolase (TIGR01509 family)
MDGVLVDTFPFHYRAWSEVCRRRKRDLDVETFQAVFGIMNEITVPRLLGVDPGQRDLIQRIGEEKEALFRDLVRGHTEPMAGVLSWLRALRARGIPSAVATSAPRANMEALLGGSHLQPYFEALVCAEDVTHNKPAPDLFLAAAARLDVSPAQCLVIEDSLVGVQAARAAGMSCLAISSHRSASELAIADYVTADLSKLQPEAILQPVRC